MNRWIVENPATGETAAEVALCTPGEIETKIAAAVGAGREVAAASIADRVALCQRVVEIFEGNADEYAAAISAQMGKPVTEARGELGTMAARARHMVSIAKQCLADVELPRLEGFERHIERVPVGLVLNVAAWNYPLLIPVGVVIPAVLAGNGVLLKHSRRTPLCGDWFADAFAKAGAPEGLVATVQTDHDGIASLIAREEVGYVAFTGSVDGGRAVSRAAAGRFIDVGLELGGKDPAYVREDADIEHVAANLAEGAFYNAGQSCCGVERIYVARTIYEPFVEALTHAATAWKPGDPTDAATTLGAMAQAGACDDLAAQVDEARRKGARVTTGGSAATVGGRGRYFEATVVADATHDMTIMTEESFGPVVGVAAVDSDDAAVAAMNDSRYGLTASVWTHDVDAARSIARRLETGTVFMNRCDYLDPALPWSGWKDTGVGITLSELGFERLTRTRSHHFRTA